MSNERCKAFFAAACKTTSTPQRITKKAVWGKSVSSRGHNAYWLGNESKEIRGHCIWCARAEAVLNRLIPQEYWIPRDMKKGALSKQLGIPESQNIPLQLLEDITSAPVGAVLRNKYGVGKREIRVTRLVKRRANLAMTLKRMRRNK